MNRICHCGGERNKNPFSYKNLSFYPCLKCGLAATENGDVLANEFHRFLHWDPESKKTFFKEAPRTKNI